MIAKLFYLDAVPGSAKGLARIDKKVKDMEMDVNLGFQPARPDGREDVLKEVRDEGDRFEERQEVQAGRPRHQHPVHQNTGRKRPVKKDEGGELRRLQMYHIWVVLAGSSSSCLLWQHLL